MNLRGRTLSVLVLATTGGISQTANASETNVSGWRLIETSAIPGDGSQISQPSYETPNWIPAVVPGTVLTSMVQAGRYPEPLYGLNNLSIPESLCRQSYWYRAEFEAAKGDRRTWLRFDGVNYMAEVWVDGHDVGSIKGAFTRGLFDVTQWVKPGEKAAVAVKMLPPNHPGVPYEQSIAAGAGPNGGATGADGVTIAATVGWDWIPGIRDRDMGLWQGVSLLSTGDVTIHDPFVKTTLPLPKVDTASLTVSTTLQNSSTQEKAGTLEGSIEGTPLKFKAPLTLAAGETKEVLLPAMTLNRPKLWWPNGYGAPNLYKLRLRFLQNGRESDSSSTNFGVRQMSYFVPSNPNLTVQVNGVPVLCRGGNWGLDEAMKRSPDDRIDAQLRMHRDANCNMVRNWVGQSTQENFYNACDKYGIMVWDDFWLANPSDGPDPVDDDLFLANAREKILRYRNHPSIAIWCGRNEGMPPAKIEAGLESMTKDLDGTRFYQPHSAAINGVSGGGPYGQVAFSRYSQFGKGLHTEVGAPSIPTLESIEGMMPQKDWWPINDDWAYHDMVRGAQGGDRYPGVLARRYGPVAGFKDFVRKGAMLTYETYRAIFEGRNARLFAPTTGTLLWMSNPSQPSFVWQLYHHDLDPTPAMFGTKIANEPVHVLMEADGSPFVVNSTPTPFDGQLVTDTFDEHGGLLKTETTAISIGASQSKPLSTSLKSRIVRLRLKGKDGKLVSDNVYWFASQGDDVSFLDKLPKVTLEGSTKETKRGLSVTLRNPSKTVALLTHLSLRHEDGSRVLPVFYSDNYIHVFPGESKTVEIEGSRGTQVYVDGWNLAGVKGPGLKTNADAKPEPPISPAAPAPPRPGVLLSLACGAQDVQGYWTADQKFVEGGEAAFQEGPVTGSDLPQDVLQTERWGECAYRIPAPAGRYRVRLTFAETSQPRIGGRKFAVEIGGKRVLDEFDVFAEAGGPNKALVKEFYATPDAQGNLKITFKKGSANEPEVRAIEILKA